MVWLYAEAVARGDSFGNVVRVDVAASRLGSQAWLNVGVHLGSPMPAELTGERLASSVGPCDVVQTQRRVDGWSVREVLYFTVEPVPVASVGASDYAEPVAAGAAVS